MIEAIDTQAWTMIAGGVALVAVARGARFYKRKRRSPKDGDTRDDLLEVKRPEPGAGENGRAKFEEERA